MRDLNSIIRTNDEAQAKHDMRVRSAQALGDQQQREAQAKPSLYDHVGAIMAYEEGELDRDGTVALFQHLVDTGLAWQLQGSYGRTAAAMIEAGLVSRRVGDAVAFPLARPGHADGEGILPYRSTRGDQHIVVPLAVPLERAERRLSERRTTPNAFPLERAGHPQDSAPLSFPVARPGHVHADPANCDTCAVHYGDDGVCDEGKPINSPHRKPFIAR